MRLKFIFLCKCYSVIMIKLFKSFGYAWQGLLYCYKSQLNFRIHLLVLVVVVICGFAFSISNGQWLFIISAAMLVLSLELLNTALEFLSDKVSKEFDPAIKIVKDVSAAAVLVCAAGSVLGGLIIFLPKIFHLLNL